MENLESETEIIAHLIRWGASQPLLRAMILTSTRAIPHAPVDLYSDYDVILVLLDVQPFFASRSWLSEFGAVLALYRDPLEQEHGFAKSGYVIQFESGLKIDFNLWQVEILQRIAASPQLPPEFDAGYRVLLDKDCLTATLPPPTYQAYIPKPPSEAEYLEAIEVFFLEAFYVAKYLLRDDLMAARFILDNFMKHEHLLPMLEWRLEIDHGWSVRPGLHGRRLKKWLRPDLWTRLECTYTGPSFQENWDALYTTIDLMRKAAIEVGEGLGYPYPHDLHRRSMSYLDTLRQTFHNQG